MLIGLISFMLSEDMTTGATNCSKYQRRTYAKDSVLFNLQNLEFVGAFKNELEKLGIDLTKALEDAKSAVHKPQNHAQEGGFLNNYTSFFGIILVLLLGFLLRYYLRI